jgi:hypothetical protein
MPKTGLPIPKFNIFPADYWFATRKTEAASNPSMISVLKFTLEPILFLTK